MTFPDMKMLLLSMYIMLADAPFFRVANGQTQSQWKGLGRGADAKGHGPVGTVDVYIVYHMKRQ